MTHDATGNCHACGGLFSYQLIHNGFNDSAHAYCDRYGPTALFSGWCKTGGRVFEILGAQHISLARLEYFQEI
jgi:hypothetical protein